MNELMLHEMLDQPRALTESLHDLRAQVATWELPACDEMLLTGSGDSLFAAMALQPLLARRLNVAVRVAPSMTAARFSHISARTLVVPISVSGEVVRTREAALTARDQEATVIAVVANRESSLAHLSHRALVMPPPLTRQTPHTRDYTLTLLALAVLCEALQGNVMDELDAWPSLVASLLEMSLTWAQDLIPVPADRPVWFLGAGPDHGTAAYGALKFWEAGGSRAWYDDLEEFGHGPQLMARPGDDMVLLAPGPSLGRAIELIPGMRRMGLRTILVAERAALEQAILPECYTLGVPTLGSWEWSPFLSCIPLQAMTYAYTTFRAIDTMLPLGGQAFGEVFDEVHNEWMRQSAVELFR